MRVQITDDDALAALSPRNIRIYLASRGWQRQPVLAQQGPDVWTLPVNAGTYEIVAPSSSDARDLRRTVAEMLRTLSIVEDRSELDVMRDLSTLSYDVQYVRTRHSGPSGTTPLRDAAEAFSAAVALIGASTASYEEPRLVLPSRRPHLTQELVRKVLAGPTTEGSYVISIWVPIPPRLTPDEDHVLFDTSSGEPFERIATRRLHQALSATSGAATEILNGRADIEAFTSRVQDGVSANLCEALTLLAGDEAQSFDVRFAWALDRPVANLEPEVPFSAESLPVIQEAARVMREQVPEEEVRLRGNVVRLHREGNLGAGDVTIAGVIVDDPSGKLRRVSVNVSEPDYQEAINAHEGFAEVEVVGSLLQRGTRTQMVNPSGLVIRPSSDAT